MPARELQEQLDSLREQLDRNPPLSLEEREHLHELMQQIEAQIKLEEATNDNNLVDGVNTAVERFEADHPDLTAILRNIANHLHSMGI
ncbi:DUF4404 family protein [Pseudomonas mosselii]|uniref:DUF4404 family protein n=1 Tax=Pseudomonas mosselii TaxID=78327 RepID=UPI0016472B25|nr:DUF4404 family protein [Pseudomonas mosselii]MBC3458266.1 DUF4404 family protein [Pseudomonas mosselii]